MNIIEIDWNEKTKRLLKSELVRRGISTEDLVNLLENIGVEETKASIDSKISRGTFSAAFLIQCLSAMGIKNFMPEIEGENSFNEPKPFYQTRINKIKNK